MGQSNAGLPDAITRNGLCTHCGQISQFTISGSFCLGEFNIGYDMFENTASILRCRSCFEHMFVLSNDLMPMGSGEEVDSFPFYYFPPLISKGLDVSVPMEIALCVDEGQKCLSVGAYRAAVIMFRSALAEFISSNEPQIMADRERLNERLEVIARECNLHPSLVDWTKSLKMLRGERDLSERYKEVTKEEAFAIASFVNQLLVLQFEMPSPRKRALDSASTQE